MMARDLDEAIANFERLRMRLAQDGNLWVSLASSLVVVAMLERMAGDVRVALEEIDANPRRRGVAGVSREPRCPDDAEHDGIAVALAALDSGAALGDRASPALGAILRAEIVTRAISRS